MTVRPPDDLDRRLTADAAAGGPPFSPDLHARIMDRLATVVPRPAPRPLPLYWLLPAATAAALLIGFHLYNTRSVPPVPTHRRLAAVPSVPRIGDAVTSLAMWSDAPYAHLDRDTEKCFSYVARQLDVVPRRR